MINKDDAISVPLIINENNVQENQQEKKRKPSLLSRLFFCQVYPILKNSQKQKATKVPIENDMIDDLDSKESSDNIYEKFQHYFYSNKQRRFALHITLLKTFKCKILNEYRIQGQFTFAMSLLFFQISLDMTVPLLIRSVIQYISQPEDERDTNHGIQLVLAIFCVRFLSTILAQHNYLSLWKIGNDSYSAISMALMAKGLKVSLQSNKKHKSGEVLNLMQVDTRKIQWIAFQLRGILFMPLQIGIALYMMFNFIGVSFLAGLGVIVLTSAYNLRVGRLLQTNQKELMKARDKRTKSANELFSSIKFIKINALEDYFIKRLADLREIEIKILRSRFILNGLSIMSVWMSPVLVVNATFALFIILNGELDASNAFAMIGLFSILQGPLTALPNIINSLIEANISMNRVANFLLTNEIMTQCINHERLTFDLSDLAIQIKNGTFYWKRKGESDNPEDNKKNDSKQKAQEVKSAPITTEREKYSRSLLNQSLISAIDNENTNATLSKVYDVTEEDPYKPILKNINLEIRKGEFVAFVGDVGSGKSSILSSLIGEMIYVEGDDEPQISIQGNIAYVSQRAWIQNATVKENILFGIPYDEQRYHDALKYSCFTQDLEVLIKGDQTMIGEKGVNLSGGQKARISLARAIYSQSDIYLLDDPISAVDVHVGKFIMHKCLNGCLKDKTRILVTHALNYTQFADKVYLFENGSIIESGSFSEIRESVKFQRIYEKFYKQSHKTNVDEKEPQVDLLEEVNLDGEEEKEIDENDLEEKVLKQISLSRENSANPSQKSEETGKDKEKERRDSIDKLMMDEDRTKGNVEWETYKKYFIMTGGLSFFLLIGSIQFAWMLCRIGQSLWLAFWTQRSSEAQKSNEDFNNSFYLEIYSAFTIFFGIFAFLRIILISLNNITFAQKIHNQMVNCLSYAPQCGYFERVPLGRIMNRFTKDQQVLDNEINWNVSSLYINLALLLSNTFMNLYGSTVYMIFPVILYFYFAWRLQRFYMHANRELYRLESISKSPILSFFGESLQGLPVIRAFGRDASFLSKHASNMDLNRKIFIQQILVGTWFNLTLSLCSFFVNMGAIIFCIFYSTKNPAFAGLLMTYASSLDQNVQFTITALASLETSIISFERCLSYTQVKPERGYTDLVKSRLEDTDYDENQKYIQSWPSEGKIEYQEFSVKYREGLPNALNQVSFQIHPKDKIGVVGRTGAGKSTLTLTLLRILEGVEGKLLIDGVDTSTLSLKQLRESITMIMQDATIFEGTLRDNIDPLRNYSDEDIQRIMKLCCLTELSQKREGLESKILEGGENLSAGEKQLVCIARAVLKKSPIVLIDEATANIDIETEHQIQETIQKGFEDCTVVTIAHRINTILHCDKILVVDKGTIKEFGPTNDLLNDKNSTFYGIFQEALNEQKQQQQL